MSIESINHRSIRAWLTVAMFAPLAHYSGGSWPVLLVLILGSIGLIGLLPKDPGRFLENKIICTAECIWLIILASHYLKLSSCYWPGEKSEFVVPAALLLLGAYSCKGRPARTAGVLYWFLLLMAIPFALAAIEDSQPKWLLTENLQCSAWVVPVLLLPGAAVWLPAIEQEKGTAWTAYLLGLGAWMAVSAVLSPNIAASLDVPFRNLGQSLTLGTGSRFESLVSVMITLGWFALASFFLKLVSHMLESLGVKETVAPWAAAGAGIVLNWLDVQLNPLFSAGTTLFLWILVPMMHCKKISKKSEKSA